MDIRSQNKDSPHSISTFENEDFKAHIILSHVLLEKPVLDTRFPGIH